MGKKSASEDRKARLEEVRKAQQSQERRRTLLVAGVAGAIVVALVVAVTVVIRNQLADRDITRIGVAAGAAGCDPIITDPVKGASVHVGPGTDQPDKTTVKYDTVPPSSGEHFATPESPSQAFYTESNRPPLEKLVHNLEHGYSVVWYDPKLPQAQIDQLKKLAPLARDEKYAGAKFIVSAWDTSRGALPSGKQIALSHWGAKQGHRQLCGQVSGDVIAQFVKKFPYTDSPEPNAA